MNVRLNTVCATAVVAALLVPAALAQGAAAPTKIAIINIQGAILATKDGERARNEITKKFEGRFKELQGRAEEINRLKDQFNKGANTMAAEAREKLQREVDDKQKKFGYDQEDLQADVQQEEGRMVNEIGQKMVQVIDGHAKENGYAVVLDVSGQQNPVLWAANGIDITQDIVKLYDAKHATAAATTPGAVKPPAASVKPAMPPPAVAPKKP